MTNSDQGWKARAIGNQRRLYKILATTHRAVSQGRPSGGWVAWCDCGWTTLADTIGDADYLAVEYNLATASIPPNHDWLAARRNP